MTSYKVLLLVAIIGAGGIRSGAFDGRARTVAAEEAKGSGDAAAAEKGGKKSAGKKAKKGGKGEGDGEGGKGQ